MKAKVIFLLLAILAFGSVQAQELSLSKFEETMEPDAVRFKVMDSNGVACALLKIGMVAKDPIFSGAVQAEYKEGEYWVYVPEGTESILIKSSNFVPFDCEFKAPVQSLFTYRLTIQPSGNGGGGGGEGTTPQGETITISIPGTSESFNMVLVKPGMFEMGATPEQNSKENDENPVHWVRISKPFYIGETEVTQALWEAVMGSNPSVFPEPKNPVESVSWADAQRFINQLNGLTGKNFSLPSEAQWEYAARGGHKSQMNKFSGSNTPAEVGWSKENSRRPHEVKALKPNEIGIYDMSGNVWELCLDFKNDYPKDTQVDPIQTKKSDNRVRRGGSWNGESEQMRNAYRRRITEDHASMDTGLRLVLQE